jgi:hypothetical protein
LQLGGADRQPQRQMLYVRLRVMNPPAFQELRVVAFDRPGHMVVRDGRYSVDVEIIDANGVVQPKRCAGAILPDYVPAFDTELQKTRHLDTNGAAWTSTPHIRQSLPHIR